MSLIVTLKIPKALALSLADKDQHQIRKDTEKTVVDDSEEFVDPVWPNDPDYSFDPPDGYCGKIADHFDVSRFKLDNPRLIKKGPLRFRWTTERNPKTGEFDWKHPIECYPITPPDDIKKELFVHPELRKFRWTGPDADEILKREIRKYNYVKEFWLFEYQNCFSPVLDDKHVFCAYYYWPQIQSPWVRAWLQELIGEDNMAAIMLSYKDYVIPRCETRLKESSEKKWNALLEVYAKVEARLAEEQIDRVVEEVEKVEEAEEAEDRMDIG